MLVLKLAVRNVIARGMQTWLNVFVLSLAFVAIVWLMGFYDGMHQQAMKAMVDTELGGGQFWHRTYDPSDPLTLEESYAPLSEDLTELVAGNLATPILITIGAIFPQGRVQTAMLKGIEPSQRIVDLPSNVLKPDDSGVIPGLIGTRMAEKTDLHVGDYVTVRWRDANGTFDATDVKIVHIMSTTVQAVDNSQIWLPLKTLRQMLDAPESATLVTLSKEIDQVPESGVEWIYRDMDYLLADLMELVEMKKVGGSIFMTFLLAMALLAIFDTQVLTVFRRRKEMGMLMALGMTRGRLISLFTLEGTMQGVLALLIGAVYGIPLMYYGVVHGLPLPEAMDDFGVALSSRLYSSYSAYLLVWSTALVLIAVTIVSFLPTRRITKLKPTDALRGKLS